RVKSVQAGRILRRPVRGLPQNLKNLPYLASPAGDMLLSDAYLREGNLLSQEAVKTDAVGLERLRIERGPRQARQCVGLEKDRSLVRHDEVRTGVAAARQDTVGFERLVHDRGGDVGCKAAGADFLCGLGKVLRPIVE